MATYQLIPKTFDISTAALAVEIVINLQVISFPFLSFCPHNSHCHLQQLDKELRGKNTTTRDKGLGKIFGHKLFKAARKYLEVSSNCCVP